MKVELSFNQVGTVCTSSVVENVDLDKVTQHLNDERRFVDLYEMERIYFKYCIRKYLIHLRSSVVASVYKFVYKNSVEMRVFK